MWAYNNRIFIYEYIHKTTLGKKDVLRADILEGISDEEWASLALRLTAYATTYFRNQYPNDSIGPEDFAQAAIIKLLEGQRRMKVDLSNLTKSEVVAELFYFLTSVIKSDIYHSRRRKYLRIETIHSFTEKGYAENEAFSSLEADILRDKLLEVLKADELACRIIVSVLDRGFEKPRHIAEDLGVSVKEIYNAKKRIKRTFTQSALHIHSR